MWSCAVQGECCNRRKELWCTVRSDRFTSCALRLWTGELCKMPHCCLLREPESFTLILFSLNISSVSPSSAFPGKTKDDLKQNMHNAGRRWAVNYLFVTACATASHNLQPVLSNKLSADKNIPKKKGNKKWCFALRNSTIQSSMTLCFETDWLW